jgi:hypothetical protein
MPVRAEDLVFCGQSSCSRRSNRRSNRRRCLPDPPLIDYEGRAPPGSLGLSGSGRAASGRSLRCSPATAETAPPDRGQEPSTMGSKSNRHEWPQVHHWALAPFANSEVFRVTLTDGTPAHLRPDDGSALLLPELVARGVPTPRALAPARRVAAALRSARDAGVGCQVARPPRLPHTAPLRCVAGPPIGRGLSWRPHPP